MPQEKECSITGHSYISNNAKELALNQLQCKKQQFINWRELVDPKFLMPNKLRTQETDISKLKDEELIISLAGLKELASLRGYSSVNFDVLCADPAHITLKCTINWNGNHETEGKDVEFSAVADANTFNTKGIVGKHLGAVAENRSFGRCVRNFLKIHIVTDAEVEGTDSEDQIEGNEETFPEGSPHQHLKNCMDENNIDLNKIKEMLGEDKRVNLEKINSIADVPKGKCFKLIAQIKKEKD